MRRFVNAFRGDRRCRGSVEALDEWSADPLHRDARCMSYRCINARPGERRMERRRTALALFSMLVALPAGPAAAADADLIAAAKKEGELNWYTTQIIPQ